MAGLAPDVAGFEAGGGVVGEGFEAVDAGGERVGGDGLGDEEGGERESGEEHDRCE